MVKLKTESPISEKKHPLTYTWDKQRRKNYNLYETKLNEYLYNFQTYDRSPIYSYISPNFIQNKFLDFQITKKMQEIGNYSQNEINEYKKINSNIEKNLKKTFGISLPVYGLGVGILLQFIPFKFNLSLANNISLLAVPIFVNFLHDKFNLVNKHNSMEFLNWTISKRVAESNKEVEGERVCVEELEKFRNNFGEGNGLELFKRFLRL